MTISLKLLDSVKSIEQKVNTAIADHMNKLLITKSTTIINKIKPLIPKWIKDQPEMVSLTLSSPQSLAGQFGIYQNPQNIVDTIADSVSSAISIEIKKYSKNLKGGGLIMNVQPTDFSNLLALQEGHTIYHDGDLHWLDWLLNRGDETIVVGYQYNPQTGIGRSRLGNMIEGSYFRVPPQYSGTADNNFITRALSGKEQEIAITKIFKQELS